MIENVELAFSIQVSVTFLVILPALDATKKENVLPAKSVKFWTKQPNFVKLATPNVKFVIQQIKTNAYPVNLVESEDQMIKKTIVNVKKGISKMNHY